MPDMLRGGIVINEVLVDPNGANNFDTDGNGTAGRGDEFIELLNTSSSAIDISGLEIWDARQDNWFTFPAGTVLQPGAVAVVVVNVQAGGSLPPVLGNNLAFDAGINRHIFNNNGDNLVVYDPDDDEFIQATYNGDNLDDPTATPPSTYLGFSPTATRVGSGEDFGSDQDGISIQRTNNGFVNDATPTPGAANVCFASGTMIATPDGFKKIEDLAPGDFICTRRSGPQPVRWVFSREITCAELLAYPLLRPIWIPGKQRLRVSRQHRVLATGQIAQRMFGKEEVLVPAKDLIDCCGCEIDQSLQSVKYFHILLDRHHVINANGLAAESLYLGREGLNAMSREALAELSHLLPAVASSSELPKSALCRTSISGPMARNLARRHHKNSRELVAQF